MKTVLFIPGFREGMQSRDYKSALAVIESKGYRVKFVPIDWNRTTIEDWTNELQAEYSKYKPAEIILAGFSYSSMTAFMTATVKNPSELWLANIGHRRADSFRKLDFNSLAKSIKCKTLIVVGEVEAAKYPLIAKRSKIAHQHIAGSKLVVVKGVDHDVSDKNYIAAIEGAI